MKLNIYCNTCNTLNNNLKLHCNNCGNIIEPINQWYNRSGSINLIFFGFIIFIINYYLLKIFSDSQMVYYTSLYFSLLALIIIIIGINIYRKCKNRINDYKKVFIQLEKSQISKSFVFIISSIITIEIGYLFLLNIKHISDLLFFITNIFYQSYIYGFLWGFIAAGILIPFNIILKKESVKITDSILNHFLIGCLTIIIFIIIN